MFNIVLVEPEIPQNTGNIVRTCAATGFTTKAQKVYSQINFKRGDFLVFGKETRGLPEELLKEHKDACVRIPMIGETRSLNLSNSVAIAVYEGLRQQNFDGFNLCGNLHRLKW